MEPIRNFVLFGLFLVVIVLAGACGAMSSSGGGIVDNGRWISESGHDSPDKPQPPTDTNSGTGEHGTASPSIETRAVKFAGGKYIATVPANVSISDVDGALTKAESDKSIMFSLSEREPCENHEMEFLTKVGFQAFICSKARVDVQVDLEHVIAIDHNIRVPDILDVADSIQLTPY